MAAADPVGLEALWTQRHATKPVVSLESIDALVADREARLMAYGGAAYVKRYRALVDAAREAERKLEGAFDERLSRAVATTFYRLLAVKDEYEVARLHSDAAFRSALEAQFEGVAGKDFGVKFNLAPPTISRAKHGAMPQKKTFGQWMWPVFGVMAKWRGLRGTVLDPFGRTVERRMERELSVDYDATMRRAFGVLDVATADDVVKLAELHSRVRWYGHVKLANLAAVKRSERLIVAGLHVEAATGAAVQAALDEAKGLGASLRGIPVVVAK